MGRSMEKYMETGFGRLYFLYHASFQLITNIISIKNKGTAPYARVMA